MTKRKIDEREERGEEDNEDDEEEVDDEEKNDDDDDDEEEILVVEKEVKRERGQGERKRKRMVREDGMMKNLELRVVRMEKEVILK